MISVSQAVYYSFCMGLAILFCRAFPFILFRKSAGAGLGGGVNSGETGGRLAAFFSFVERVVPPAAMTVLAFNDLAGRLAADRAELVPVLAASALTAVLHLWKRNPLFSIIGGTALYMALKG